MRIKLTENCVPPDKNSGSRNEQTKQKQQREIIIIDALAPGAANTEGFGFGVPHASQSSFHWESWSSTLPTPNETDLNSVWQLDIVENQQKKLRFIYENLLVSIAEVRNSPFEVVFPERLIDTITLRENYLIVESPTDYNSEMILDTVKRHLSHLNVDPETFHFIAIQSGSMSITDAIERYQRRQEQETRLSLEEAVERVQEELTELQTRDFKSFSPLDLVSGIELREDFVLVCIKEKERFRSSLDEHFLPWVFEDIKRMFSKTDFDGEIKLRANGPLFAARKILQKQIDSHEHDIESDVQVEDLFSSVDCEDKSLVVQVEPIYQDETAIDVDTIFSHLQSQLDTSGYVDIPVYINGPLSLAAKVAFQAIRDEQKMEREEVEFGPDMDELHVIGGIDVQDSKLTVKVAEICKAFGPFDQEKIRALVEKKLFIKGFRNISVEVEPQLDYSVVVQGLQTYLEESLTGLGDRKKALNTSFEVNQFEPITKTFYIDTNQKNSEEQAFTKKIVTSVLESWGVYDAEVRIDYKDNSFHLATQKVGDDFHFLPKGPSVLSDSALPVTENSEDLRNHIEKESVFSSLFEAIPSSISE